MSVATKHIQHTPGPWVMDRLGIITADDGRIHIASVLRTYTVDTRATALPKGSPMANARLIEAAPAMYEFVHAVIESFDGNPTNRVERMLLECARVIVAKVGGAE